LYRPAHAEALEALALADAAHVDLFQAVAVGVVDLEDGIDLGHLGDVDVEQEETGRHIDAEPVVLRVVGVAREQVLRRPEVAPCHARQVQPAGRLHRLVGLLLAAHGLLERELQGIGLLGVGELGVLVGDRDVVGARAHAHVQQLLVAPHRGLVHALELAAVLVAHGQHEIGVADAAQPRREHGVLSDLEAIEVDVVGLGQRALHPSGMDEGRARGVAVGLALLLGAARGQQDRGEAQEQG
jgi:hypothetical protein